MFNTHLYTRSFVNLLFSIWDQYHDSEEERKEIEHIYMNDDTQEEEKKVVPFEKTRLTKFNNHYYGTPKHKWVFYPEKQLQVIRTRDQNCVSSIYGIWQMETSVVLLLQHKVN